MWFPSGVESDADSIDALKLENAKLHTQVESLKAIAEQNTNLMWSMQSYQYQVDMTRQQYDKRLKEKDYEVQNFSSSVCYFFQLTQDISWLTENVVVYSNNNYIPGCCFFLALFTCLFDSALKLYLINYMLNSSGRTGFVSRDLGKFSYLQLATELSGPYIRM